MRIHPLKVGLYQELKTRPVVVAIEVQQGCFQLNEHNNRLIYCNKCLVPSIQQITCSNGSRKFELLEARDD